MWLGSNKLCAGAEEGAVYIGLVNKVNLCNCSSKQSQAASLSEHVHAFKPKCALPSAGPVTVFSLRSVVFIWHEWLHKTVAQGKSHSLPVVEFKVGNIWMCGGGHVSSRWDIFYVKLTCFVWVLPLMFTDCLHSVWNLKNKLFFKGDNYLDILSRGKRGMSLYALQVICWHLSQIYSSLDLVHSAQLKKHW